MKRLAVLILALASLVLGGWAGGTPVAGQKLLKHRMQPATRDGGQVVPDVVEIKEKFRGGRRAMVIIEGDHLPVVPLAVAVYDEANRLVGEDVSEIDVAGVLWYPARDATYKIVIQNFGTDYPKPEERFTDVRITLR
jgi:hypothetical protein